MLDNAEECAISLDHGAPATDPDARLKAERVQLYLAELPGWKLAEDGGAILRVFRFSGSGSPLLFAALVGVLAGEAGQQPVVTVTGETVICQLTTPEVGGVTLRDVALAGKISLLE